MINNYINFKNRTNHLSQSEQFTFSIDMKRGVFTDAGYRFRKNVFKRSDYWYPNPEDEVTFYDIVYFNNDPINTGIANTKISETYFRIHN